MNSRSNDLIEKLVGLFIRKPKLGHLIMIFVFVMGMLSLSLHRYEVMSKINMGIINVTTSKPGASPEEIALSISVPLEEEILKVTGVRKVVSRSMENLSLITIILDPNIAENEVNDVFSKIQRAVDRAEAKLPQDLLEKPYVEILSTDKLAVAELHISGKVSEKVLRQQAKLWEQRLRAIEGVAGTEKIGYRRAEVSIEPDLDKMVSLGFSYIDIEQALTSRVIRDSTGSVTSTNVEKNVLINGQFSDPTDVGDVIIRSMGPGNDVQLRNIAHIYYNYEEWQTKLRVDGQLSIALHIKKHSDADELKTISNIRNYIENTAKAPGIELKIVNDVSRFTTDMLDALIGNAILGIASVFLILLAFLGGKMAFWVSVGLPFSILASFSGMLAFDLSVNSLTLMSMILVLGMLVDDAIVTGEAIQARKEEGLNPIEAAIQGTRDIAAPLFVSVFTTILAFLPIVFLGGLEGKFVAAIPIVVGITLAASLFESKFLLPAHLAHTRLPSEPRKWLSAIQQLYEKVIAYLLARRKLATSAIVFAFIFIGIVSISQMRFQLYPETAIDTIKVPFELANGKPFKETQRKAIELESMIRDTVPQSDLLNIVSEIGHHDTDPYGGSMGRNQSWGLITVYLKPHNQVEQDQRVTLKQLQDKAENMEGFAMLRVEPLSDAPIMGKPVELEVMSAGEEKLVVAEDIKSYLTEIEGITQVWDSNKQGKSIVDLKLKYEDLSAYGLSVNEVAQAVRVAMDGALILQQQMASERVYFRLRLPENIRQKISTLEHLPIINKRGEPVALSSIANLELIPGDAFIKHHNGRRTITVYADIDRNVTDVVSVNKKLTEYISKPIWATQYPTITFYQGGELEQQTASYASLGVAFIICLMLIFIVLVVLFDSFSQPMLVMSVLPFSLVGVFLTFSLHDLPMSFIALIGVLGLIGVLVNDAVVMVFTLNKAAHNGSSSDVAKMAATRFRPILITSLTTLAGLLPTAYGVGGYNPFVAPMVMTMAWGVVFGTFISLLLLPCLFMLNDDLRSFFKQVILKKKESS